MGIPGFSSWLTEKYPKIKTDCKEVKPYTDGNGVFHPVDETRQNPNRIEFDNLYVDMNQIIHRCTKSSNNTDEIIKLVFDYIDRIFSIVRPRRLLYMAFDGVAPRAKRNNQRSRCFLHVYNIPDGIKNKFSTKEQVQTEKTEEQDQTEKTEEQGQTEKTEYFDKYHIKPGTSFMSKLSDCLRNYIYSRMNTNPAWQSLKVILSDANVPGEGEYKIIEFIRRQRLQQDYDKDTKHIVYGSDSDLILLGLATHERYFTIIYEEDIIDSKLDHDATECDNKTNAKGSQLNELSLATLNNPEQKFIFIDFSILRESIHDELRYRKPGFRWKRTRSIDDWVFVCLLLGNDYLPALPSIDRPKYSMDTLLLTYTNIVPMFNKYLTKEGKADMDFVGLFLGSIGKEEYRIFRERHGRDQKRSKDSLDSNDTIRLWEDGWHERYYKVKFDISQDNLREFCTEVAQHYVRGLCWILQYYYNGVPSWDWYYPYHYTPFASDLAKVKQVPLNFDKQTQPLSPLEQMMATFAPQNAHHLPLQWQPLMLNNESSISKFYPKSFTVDPNDKFYRSEYVALIPFIDEKLLLPVLKSIPLTLEEEKRNKHDNDRLFIHSTNSCYKQFKKLYGSKRNQITQNNPLEIETKKSVRLAGYIWPDDNESIIPIGEDREVTIPSYENIQNNQVLCVKYSNL